ncbi:hypothetical protein SSS_08512 [Sarcoptes scabiei]|uniref:Uncharacterized protein n=1 Tax=Sarcoptes scabiei TaxID=52283 RepID=A0A834RG39_SARSC|nr:hypothetical protein SSS_08512 [Sarcoptes scabiei]
MVVSDSIGLRQSFEFDKIEHNDDNTDDEYDNEDGGKKQRSKTFTVSSSSPKKLRSSKLLYKSNKFDEIRRIVSEKLAFKVQPSLSITANYASSLQSENFCHNQEPRLEVRDNFEPKNLMISRKQNFRDKFSKIEQFLLAKQDKINSNRPNQEDGKIFAQTAGNIPDVGKRSERNFADLNLSNDESEIKSESVKIDADRNLQQIHNHNYQQLQNQIEFSTNESIRSKTEIDFKRDRTQETLRNLCSLLQEKQLDQKNLSNVLKNFYESNLYKTSRKFLLKYLPIIIETHKILKILESEQSVIERVIRVFTLRTSSLLHRILSASDNDEDLCDGPQWDQDNLLVRQIKDQFDRRNHSAHSMINDVRGCIFESTSSSDRRPSKKLCLAIKNVTLKLSDRNRNWLDRFKKDDHDCYLFVLIEFGIRILTTSVITIKSREIHSDSLITIDINETFTDLPNECFDITVKFYFMFHPNFNNYHHNHLGIVNRLRILNNFKHRFRQRNCHSSMPIRFSSLAEQKTNYLQQHHHPRQSLLSKFLKRFQLRSIRSQSKLNQSTSTSSLTSLSSTSASIAKILSLGKQLHRDVSLDPSLPSVSYGQCQCCNYKYRKPFNDSNFSTILKHSDHQRAKNDLIRSKSRTSNSLASNFSLLGQTHLTNHNQSSSAKSTRLEDFNYFTIFDDEIYFDSEVTYDI